MPRVLLSLMAIGMALLLVSCSRASNTPTAPTSATANAFGQISSAANATTVNFAECLRGSQASGCFSAVRAAARTATALAVGVPGSPSNLTATASGSTVTLTWTAASGSDSGTAYIIEAGSASGLANLANLSTGNALTLFQAFGVGNGTYYVRVRAVSALGISAPSNESVLMVPGSTPCGPPGAPNGLIVTLNAGSVLGLAWNAASGSPTSYVIEAGSQSGSVNLANSDLGSAATTMTATGVGNGTYYVRLRAKNACGVSGPSNEVTFVVGSTPCQPLGAPGGLFVTFNSGGVLGLSWNTASGSPTSYVIEAGSQSGLANLANRDLGSSATTMTTSGVGSGTYYVRLRAKNACGVESGPSNELTLVAGTCPVAVSPASIQYDGATHSFSALLGVDEFPDAVTVTMSGACSWSVTSDAPDWLAKVSNPSPPTFSGSGYYYVYAEPNDTGVTRVGTLRVAGQPLQVTQTACPYSLAPGSITVGPGATTASFRAQADPLCIYTLDYSNFLSVGSISQSPVPYPIAGGGKDSYADGGTNTIVLNIPRNPGATARTGTLRMTGRSGAVVAVATITQSGTP